MNPRNFKNVQSKIANKRNNQGSK